tara:strand:- start:47 stop:466 length:420 start_codon:yes stop_codon:yes gene_type:complete
MKKIFLIILIIFSNPVIGKEVDVFKCFSRVGLGLDLLDNIYSYKDQGIKENFKIKLIAKEINFVSGKIKRNYKIISKRKKPNGSTILVSHYINKDYYGGYMLTLSINHASKEYLYSSAMMGAGEILEGPVGSRGSCKKL